MGVSGWVNEEHLGTGRCCSHHGSFCKALWETPAQHSAPLHHRSPGAEEGDEPPSRPSRKTMTLCAEDSTVRASRFLMFIAVLQSVMKGKKSRAGAHGTGTEITSHMPMRGALANIVKKTVWNDGQN